VGSAICPLLAERSSCAAEINNKMPAPEMWVAGRSIQSLTCVDFQPITRTHLEKPTRPTQRTCHLILPLASP